MVQKEAQDAVKKYGSQRAAARCFSDGNFSKTNSVHGASGTSGACRRMDYRRNGR